uniref:Uncharacterized protein n=1 Tax=Panagrolaimus superbus TaxID=310955 RepID=A0A914XYV0_9BILA
MLFTSNLRKAVDHYQGSPSKTLEQKRAQLIRRHTCSIIVAPSEGSNPVILSQTSIIHKHGLTSSGRQVSFREPFIEEENEEVPSAPPPSNPPPPLPPTYAQPPASNILPPLPAQFGAPPPSAHDEWADPRISTTPTYPILPPEASFPNPASAPPLPHQALAPTQSAAQLHDDDFDDDWSDEDEEVACKN